MLSVAIFLENIRKYFCFYFYLSSFFINLLLLFTQVFCFTKYFYFYSSSFESNYFYSSTKKSYSSQHGCLSPNIKEALFRYLTLLIMTPITPIVVPSVATIPYRADTFILYCYCKVLPCDNFT